MQKALAVEFPSPENEVSAGETGLLLTGGQRSTAPIQLSTAARAYKKDQIMNLTPVQVVDRLYGVAIHACKKEDSPLAQRAISELIVGLNFEYPEISTPLFRLYRYCKDCIRDGKLEDAITVLVELRATWAQAFHLHGG